MTATTTTRPFVITDRPETGAWRRFVEGHPKGCIFHTPEMAEVFSRTKLHRPVVLAALDASGDLLALLTSVRVSTLSGPLASISSRAVFYAEPLCRGTSEGTAALEQLIGVHDRLCQSDCLFGEVRMVGAASSEVEALTESGYVLQPFVNFLIDLRPSHETLWRSLSNTCRANVRRAHRHGVEVRDITSQDGVDVLYELLRTTFTRARVPLADKSLLQAAVDVLAPLGMIKLFAAYHDGEAVAASAQLLYKDVAYEWYGGVRPTISIYPAECITWHRIEWAKQNGYARYDFGGAGDPNLPYGVRDFKAKFGGELVKYGRYRKVYAPWKLALAERVYAWSRKLPSIRVRGAERRARGAAEVRKHAGGTPRAA